MAWLDKALKSVQSTAEKTAFEADKLVRTKREEGMLSDIQKKVQIKLVDLGQAALELYRSGALADPTVAALAQELAGIEEQVQQQREKVEAIRNEQYSPAGPVAPVVSAQPSLEEEPAAPAVPTPAPPAPDSPELVVCPNCHSEVKATVTFCPECGSRLK